MYKIKAVVSPIARAAAATNSYNDNGDNQYYLVLKCVSEAGLTLSQHHLLE